MMDKIAKEAARTAARLGAEGCVIVAFFADGESYHILDAGRAPMPLPQLYAHMQDAHGIAEEADAPDNPFN